MSGFLNVALALVPLLLLLVALLLGHYPGCDAVVRFGERFAARPGKRRASRRLSRPTDHRSAAVAGGLLIAFGLARRPPPLVA